MDASDSLVAVSTTRTAMLTRGFDFQRRVFY